jgi:hypothetical protein
VSGQIRLALYWHAKFGFTNRLNEFAKIEAKDFKSFTQVKLFAKRSQKKAKNRSGVDIFLLFAGSME